MRRRLVAVITAAVVVLGMALGGSAALASISNGNVYTSNGEAGWFTQSGSRFDEVHADVTTTVTSEQAPTAAFTTGNGIGLCSYPISGGEGSGAQLGLVWNKGTGRFDVVWAEGIFTAAATPDTNGTPCTDGGALPVTLSGTTCTPGTATATATTSSCGVLDPEMNGVAEGASVYVQIRQWNTHLQFLAHDLTTGLELTADNEPGLIGFAHIAQAGTTFDSIGMSAPASNPEAFFCWVRASTTSSGEGQTQGSYFSAFSAESVDSSPSGSSADPPLVAPTVETPSKPGGLGCFTLNVGTPVS